MFELSKEIQNLQEQREMIEKKKRREQCKNDIIYTLIKLVVVIVFLTILFTKIFSININTGNDMYPSIRDGDLLLSYRLDTPSIDDIIIYKQDGKTYLGRVVAQGGDIVEFDGNGNLIINGSIQSENIFYDTFIDDTSDITYPYVVETDSYFVLSDYRTNGNDSRTFGSIKEEDNIGTIISFLRIRGM